jgi:hypothetical protein
MKEVKIWDDLIDAELHKAVYDWGQSVSWYAKALLDADGNYLKNVPNTRDFKGWPCQEYSPSVHGNANPRPDTPEEYKHELMSLYRHMVGWNDASLQERNPVLWTLFNIINQTVFDGKATTDGYPEEHALTGKSDYYIDGQDFFQKYNNGEERDEWTTFLNCRNIMPGNKDRPDKGRIGKIHKDTSGTAPYSDKHFSVLFVTNLEWEPSFGGDLKFYGDEYSGTTLETKL